MKEGFKGLKEAQKLHLFAFFAEIILAILLVYQAFKIWGVRASYGSFAVSFSQDPLDFILLAAIIVLLLAIYFALKKKVPEFFAIQEAIPQTIKETAQFKWWLSKEDPRIIALAVIQFVFVVAVAFAIAAYLDPAWEIIPWEESGIMPPLSTALNIIIFVIFAGAFIFLHNYTKNFRLGRPAAPRKPAQKKFAKK